MNREFKFRFWVEKLSKMSDWEIAKKECDRLSLLSLGGFIPMQYIGLKDNRANREVYESDIYFEIDHIEYVHRKITFVITWINERAAFAMLEVTEYQLYIADGFKAIERDFDGFYFEITQDSIDKMQYAGNIYEHHDLLK